ncbi:major facilitator superfamily domain-containing protein 6-B-like [Stegodyphus dumicola]|uniref:major facilitator superfamily domain-containing protein 6-B-like n=1 Tax=Stegodyphus dumicola TaxID=202533 RepID=UPI0015AB9548|nr:major facilitator superfamily domain-containing protein 6-B-like [Stegodyphus dumicola]
MKELGLTIKETTIIYSLIPISQFLIPPAVGRFVDKLGKYRNVLLFSLIMVFLLTIGMLYVPAVSNAEYQEQSLIKDLCNDENITRGCKCILANNSTENLMDIPSWYFTCNTEILPINNTLHAISNITNSLVSRECGYNKTLIMTTMPSNCSNTCKGFNKTAISSEDMREDLYLTFCLFATLRIAFEVFVNIAFGLVNASAVALTENDVKAGEFGKQRFWAMFAMAIFSPLAGILIDIISPESGVTSYAPAFHIHNGLIFVATIAAWFVDFEMEDRPPSCIETFKNAWKLIKLPSVLFFLLALFWLGTAWGFLETFLFLFLKELGTPAYMLGLTITVGSLSSLPFIYYSKCFVSKFGYANLMSLAVFVYLIRCVGCSYLVNPWWVMPYEAMEIFTYHLMWVTAVTYTAHICPPGLLTTTQGFIDGLHFGVGKYVY